MMLERKIVQGCFAELYNYMYTTVHPLQHQKGEV